MPLSGIKILDMTRVLAGPFCTMLLADFGAEVIKVETPQGDPARVAGIAGEGENPFFVNINRNKRSIALDLRTEGGKAVIRRLVARADVLVENYRPGVMARMGLGREALQDINPRLIYAAVSGFGKTGPYSHRPAFDFIAQAVSGFMSLNGSEDTDPLRVGIPISDTIAGLYAAFGILAALHRREQGAGRGEEVQVAMVDSLISMFSFASGAYFATGEQPPRTGNDHMVVAPYGVFHASDGPLAIAPSTEKNWLNLCRALDMEDVRQDPRFATNRDRIRHRRDINRIVAERIAVRSREEWIELLNREGVPCGPINNLREVFSDPQVLHQQMVLTSNQPSGRVQMPGFAVKMAETPARLRRPSPQIGEHTDEVLAEAGFDRAEIEKLRSEGVI
jgi:crotonobetainyl-CoA:carnitine CoA-transferase CaiB-like acyl-CoA transferase